MRTRTRPHTSQQLTRGRRALAARLAPASALLLLVGLTACGAGGEKSKGGDARGVIVVNAPSAGVVRRVLVGEGAAVGEGDAVVELVVGSEQQQGGPSSPTPDPVARAAQAIQSSESEIEAARSEVVRAEVEVQRLSPMVAAGQVPQGQLDAARADYERAQQRLQRAQSAAQSAQGGLVAARQQELNPQRPAAAATPAEQVVAARASSAGTVSVVSVKPGDRVAAGQPLATLRAGKP